MVDANESVRKMPSLLALFIVAFYGEKEMVNNELKESNKWLWDGLKSFRAS